MSNPPDHPQLLSPQPSDSGDSVGTASVDIPRVWTSARLLSGQKAVAIEHNGSLYRLQSTRAGKLILTK